MPPTAVHQWAGKNTLQAPHPARHDAVHTGVEAVEPLVKLNDPDCRYDEYRKPNTVVEVLSGKFQTICFTVYKGAQGG